MFSEVKSTLGRWQSLHEPLRGSFTLHATHCRLHFDKSQKNDIYLLNTVHVNIDPRSNN